VKEDKIMKKVNYRKLYFENNKGLRGKYQCEHCKKWFMKEEITIDHIIPQSKLAYLPIKDVLVNLQPLCRSCNSSKGNRMKGTEVGKDLIKSVVKTGMKSVFKRKG